MNYNARSVGFTTIGIRTDDSQPGNVRHQDGESRIVWHLEEFQLQKIEGFIPNQRLKAEEFFQESDLVDVLGINIHEMQNQLMGMKGSGNGCYNFRNRKGIQAMNPLLEIDFPHFDGTHIRLWILKCNGYFKCIPNILDSQKITLACMHFEGKAALWYQNSRLKQVDITWPQFLEVLSARFEEWKEAKINAEFNKLRHIGSYSDYVEKVEELKACMLLLNTTGDYSEEYFITSFISGLSEELQYFINMYTPSTLKQTVDLGRKLLDVLNFITRKIRTPTKLFTQTFHSTELLEAGKIVQDVQCEEHGDGLHVCSCLSVYAWLNWMKGHHIECVELIDSVLDVDKKEVENCDLLQGFKVCHSKGRGTGCGMDTLLIPRIEEEFPDRMLTFSALSTSKTSDTIVKPYNTTLSVQQLVENVFECMFLDIEVIVLLPSYEFLDDGYWPPPVKILSYDNNFVCTPSIPARNLNILEIMINYSRCRFWSSGNKMKPVGCVTKLYWEELGLISSKFDIYAPLDNIALSNTLWACISGELCDCSYVVRRKNQKILPILEVAYLVGGDVYELDRMITWVVDFTGLKLPDFDIVKALHPFHLIHDTIATALAYDIYRNDLLEDEAMRVAFVDVRHASLEVCIATFKKGQWKILSHAFDGSIVVDIWGENKWVGQIYDVRDERALMIYALSYLILPKFFNTLLKLINAKNTIEIGVYTCCLLLATALALSDDGKILVMNINKENYKWGLHVIQKAGVAHKIDLREDFTLLIFDEIITDRKYHGSLDFIIFYADKDNYLIYYKRLVDLVKVGTVIGCNKTVWNGLLTHVTQAFTIQSGSFEMLKVLATKMLTWSLGDKAHSMREYCHEHIGLGSFLYLITKGVAHLFVINSDGLLWTECYRLSSLLVVLFV